MSLPFSAAERDGLGTSTHVAGSAGGTVRGLCLDTVPWGAVGKINLREKHGLKGYMHPVFIAALFTIAKTWKQRKCPSTEE